MTKKTIQPVSNRVLVKPEFTKESLSDGGIILRNEEDWMFVHPHRDGVVLAVGPGKKTKKGKIVPMTVKVGDRVSFTGVAGVSVDGKSGKHTREQETIITEDDIMFIYGDE